MHSSKACSLMSLCVRVMWAMSMWVVSRAALHTMWEERAINAESASQRVAGLFQVGSFFETSSTCTEHCPDAQDLRHDVAEFFSEEESRPSRLDAQNTTWGPWGTSWHGGSHPAASAGRNLCFWGSARFSEHRDASRILLH